MRVSNSSVGPARIASVKLWQVFSIAFRFREQFVPLRSFLVMTSFANSSVFSYLRHNLVSSTFHPATVIWQSDCDIDWYRLKVLL